MQELLYRRTAAYLHYPTTIFARITHYIRNDSSD